MSFAIPMAHHDRCKKGVWLVYGSIRSLWRGEISQMQKLASVNKMAGYQVKSLATFLR
jgi:hypothetical protein